MRKAGGVYYTPEYIVRYIVENTVGKLIEGKVPTEIAKMTFADIACGSGSFLLGVFDALLQYHRNWYNANPKKIRKGECWQDEDGVYRLTLTKRREILLNNIFGVDIDAQAVEVAQLSLYLKLLEEETTASAFGYQREFHEALLPVLGRNITCGNSLVGTDILEGRLFNGEEERRLNPMNFADRFAKIMESGGFHAVVGNPPWGAFLDDVSLEYLRGHYARVVARMVDSYIYFVDKAIRLLRPGGYLGYIVPATILNQVDARPVRDLVLQHGLTHLINLGQRVFGPKVLNSSAILISGGENVADTVVLGDLSATSPEQRGELIGQSRSTSRNEWEAMVRTDPHFTYFTGGAGPTALLARLRTVHQPLSVCLLGSIQRGVTPDVVGAHVLSVADANQSSIEPALLKLSVSGPQIRRYTAWGPDQYILYTTRDTPIQSYPHAHNYLKRFRSKNSCPEVRANRHPWWALHRPRNPEIFASPKFVGLTTTKAIEIIYDKDAGLYVTDAMYVFCIRKDIDPMAFMAVMHSKCFLFLYRVSNQGEGRVIPQVKASKLESLPFPALLQHKDLRERLAGDCSAMVDAKRSLATATSEKQQEYYANRCLELERRIDTSVYQLYGLSPTEVECVEAFVA